ncbi:hypothetical protein HY479_01785 [Candidatus Uhrbacteria bacterium]|nr:hypothetical protein [Candidatus Uhrbacteria bacterium]
MARTAIVLLLSSSAILGVGCRTNWNSAARAGIPRLEIERPTNGLATTSTNAQIAGRSDATSVRIGEESIPTNNGRFAADVNLEPGTNSITIVAGNGFATTTQTIVIERQ